MTSAWEDLNPSRALIAGDWHGNTDRAINAVSWAKKHDCQAILHVGDFAYSFAPSFLLLLKEALERAGIVLGFVPGNHDDWRKLDAWQAQHGVTAIPVRPNIFYLPRTYRWTWNGVRFLAMGGAVSVDKKWRTPGTEWWPRETIDWHEAQKACDDGPADIMICHDVPQGIRIPCIEGNPYGFPEDTLVEADNHRRLLRQIVDQVQPSHLFAGHYHCRLTDTLRGQGYETVVDILDADFAPIRQNVTVLDLDDLAPHA